jgi:transcription antitermination factor NusG
MDFDVNSAKPAWYAVRAQAQRESIAELHLKRQFAEVFYPRYFVPVRGANRRVTVAARPFFPGYLFVKLDLGRDRWRSVNGTFGVIGLVQFGERPTPTPAGFVDAMLARTQGDSVIAVEDPLQIGAAVQIVGGPFHNTIGALLARPARDRVTVLIEMMTRAVQIELPRAALIPASHDKHAHIATH